MKDKKIIYILVALLAGAALGALAGYSLGQKNARSEAEVAFKKQSDVWKDQWMQRADYNPDMAKEPLLSIGGTVAEVGSDYVIINAPQVIDTPFDEATPAQRKVMVNDETAVSLVEALPTEKADALMSEYQEKVRAYDDQMARGKNPVPVTQPEIEKKTPIKLSDIHAGDTAYAASADNLRYAAEFSATTLSIRRAAPASPAPPTTPAAPAVPER